MFEEILRHVEDVSQRRSDIRQHRQALQEGQQLLHQLPAHATPILVSTRLSGSNAAQQEASTLQQLMPQSLSCYPTPRFYPTLAHTTAAEQPLDCIISPTAPKKNKRMLHVHAKFAAAVHSSN